MKAGIGLLSLLIVMAIVLYVSIGTKSHPGYDATAIEKGREAQKEASQISGRTEDGVPIEQTMQLEEVDSGGQFKRIKVISVTPQTPMDTYYHLMAGDEITRVGAMGVTDNNDFGLAKALVVEAYQNSQELVVIRNGDTANPITLKPTGSPMARLIPAGTSHGIPTH